MRETGVSGKIFFSLLIVCLMLAACGQPTAIPIAGVPSVMPKLLATVYISPTPDAAQQEATRAANPVTSTPSELPTATATPYVGVFLGEAESVSDGGPVIAPVLIDSAPTSAFPVTIAPTCPSQPDEIFGTRWAEDPAVNQLVGCPIELTASANGKVQVFERGVMYAREGETWAIAPGEGRFWYYPIQLPPPPGEPPSPTTGTTLPSDTFLTVWRSVQGLSDSIGFARTEDQTSSISTQRYQGAVLLADGLSGQVFVLVGDGRAYGPY